VPSTLGIVASSIFTPADLSPELWLDAADTSTITASSGNVSQWNNKGSLSNFTQGTGALQPVTGSSTVNGLNVLDFTAHYLTTGNTNQWKFLHDGTKWFSVAVWKAGTTANPNVSYALFGSNAQAFLQVGTSVWFDDRASVSRSENAVIFISRGVANQSTATNICGNAFHPPNQFVTFSVLADPANATAADRIAARVNNGTTASTNTSTNAASTANPSYAMQIGAAGNNVIPLTGSIAEIVIVSGANATAGNRDLIETYLNSKWGL
jgi:hypothetical protein